MIVGVNSGNSFEKFVIWWSRIKARAMGGWVIKWIGCYHGPTMEICRKNKWFTLKVEKILKGSLDLIPSLSPSVKIQIMGGKVCLRCKGKTLLGFFNILLKTKSLFTSFWRWRWWDCIQAIFLNLFYLVTLRRIASICIQNSLMPFKRRV